MIQDGSDPYSRLTNLKYWLMGVFDLTSRYFFAAFLRAAIVKLDDNGLRMVYGDHGRRPYATAAFENTILAPHSLYGFF
ncbi:hypothetical protein C8R45DRAFT_1113102 [Mycena sanguinolenta]|nr:hypothetical protein C8R45DRAFT_1113102 [Mycena sanguinolenta]